MSDHVKKELNSWQLDITWMNALLKKEWIKMHWLHSIGPDLKWCDEDDGSWYSLTQNRLLLQSIPFQSQIFLFSDSRADSLAEWRHEMRNKFGFVGRQNT